MKYLTWLLAVLLCLSCAEMPHKPTVGQELCQFACKRMGGDIYTMTEADRKCYCVFDMPERMQFGQSVPSPLQQLPGSSL